jgi:hypothetical protein
MVAAATDADCRTLHLRCGSDLLPVLRAAGFGGDFLEHAWPYATGLPTAEFAQAADQALQAAAGYPRVVIWSEHDVHDQLVLLRLLAHFAARERPPKVEMVTVGDWPAGEGAGRGRFLGLGQLSAVALRGLWPARKVATPQQLQVGSELWAALAAADPAPLLRRARSGLPELPFMAAALWRHLQELPDARSGLSLTQSLALQALAERGPLALQALFRDLTDRRDPLPGQGDLQFRDRLFALEACRQPLYLREPGGADLAGRPWTDLLQLTPLGATVLRGSINARSLGIAPWWVGGVRVTAGEKAGAATRFPFTAPLPPA